MSELTGQWGTLTRGRELTWRSICRTNKSRWRREENRPVLEWRHDGKTKVKNERQGRKGEKYSVNSVAEKEKGN